MKHGLFQRSVSLLLALVMILGNVPMNALAAEGEETTAPACEHSYDAVTTDATCSQDGSVVYTCACGDTYTETIPATGEHAWGDWTVTAEATYEAAGLETRACGCGATEEREIPQLVAAHEHAWGDWTVAAEATYEAAGLETRACQCGATENREIPQLVKEKAELSGETREIYFLNTENWEAVYITWSFDEEDFQDVAFPGEEMEEDEDLENVYVVELPVEADAVTFNDGVEVTQELLAKEAEAGLEINHAFEAELDEELDYFSAEEQVEDEEDATEWLAYEDVLEAWEEAKKAEQVAYVNGLIEALPAEITSDEQAAEVKATLAEIDSIVEAEAFPADAYQALDWAKIVAAQDALDAWAEIPVEENDPVVLAKVDTTTNTIKNEGVSILEASLLDAFAKISGMSWGTAYYDTGKTAWGAKVYLPGYHLGSQDVQGLGGNIDYLEHNESYTVRYYINEGSTLRPKWVEQSFTFTYYVYQTITVDVTDGVANAGVKIDGTTYGDKAKVEIEYGTEVTVDVINLPHYKENPATVDDFTVTENKTISVVYTPEKYKISFLSEAGADPVTYDVTYNNAPVFSGSDPVKEATNTKVYTFAGWEAVNGTKYPKGTALPAAEGDTSYTAYYSEADRLYTVTWDTDGDGDVDVTQNTYKYEDTLTVPDHTIAELDEADPYNTYTFTGWGAELPEKVTTDAAYTAKYTTAPQLYTVTWMSSKLEDGEVVSYEYAKKADYKYNDTMQKPANPTLEGYYFVGWDTDGDKKYTEGGEPAVPATVTTSATYTAVFAENPTYDVTVKYNNDTSDGEYSVQQNAAGEATITIPDEPTRVGYRFGGWYIGTSKQTPGAKITIKADTVIEAQWAELFTVTWKFENGDADQVDTDAYIAGETPTPPAAPTKAGDAQYTHTFTGWSPAVGAIEGDTTYTAQYETTVNKYNIKFVNGETLLNQQTLEYSVTPSYNCTLTKQYYHVTWSPEIAAVTGEQTYNLVWAPDNDTNKNGVADEEETITVAAHTNATVQVGNTTVDAAGGSVVYNSKQATKVTVTPAKGYYVDVTHSNELTGAHKNTWQSGVDIPGVSQADYRNVYTITVPANSGNQTVTVQSTLFQWALPVETLSIGVNGFLFSGWTDMKATVLQAIYGENVDVDLYDCEVDGFLGGIFSAKLDEPFTYKVTLKATDKYPAVTDTVTVTATDNRDYAKIETDYVNGSKFDTEAQFKNDFSGKIKVDGKIVSLQNLTDVLKGSVSWTDNKDGTYNATVKLNSSEAYKETTKEFKDLTWTVNRYGVKFVDEDGTVLLDEIEYAYGTKAADVKRPEKDPTKTGYTFDGWTVADVTNDATYTATYTINQYTITFKNGDTEVSKKTLDYNTEITAPADPEKEGHTFEGWTGFTAGMKVPAENKTFTAKWKANKYTVTWKWVDGQGNKKELPKEYVYGTSITIPAEIPTQFEVDENTKKTIIGWEGFTANMKMPANNDLVFTANYTTEKTYTATFLSDGENYAKQVIIPTDDKMDNDVVTKPTDPTQTGYRFDGWFTDAEFTTEFTAWDQAITDDITLYAKWVQQFEVTFDVEGIEKQIVDINDKATKPAVDPDKANFVFGGWQLNGVDYDFETPVTANIALTANWIADVNDNNVLDENETIAINIEGNGSVTIKGVYLVEEETVEEPAADAAVEPIAEAGDTVVDAKSGNYIFNSKTSEIIITATPVVEGGFSKSYVKQIGAKGTAALTFAEDGTFAAAETIEVKDADELKVVFEDVPVLKNPPEVVEYNFYTGEIPYEDLYASFVEAPALVGENVEYTYFARPAMKHTVSIDSLDLDASVKTLLSTVGVKDFSFDMEELWLPLDAEVKESVDLETAVSTYLTKERIGGLVDKFQDAYDAAYDAYIAEHGNSFIDKGVAIAAGTAAGSEAVKADIADIYDKVYSAAMYYGAHEFGYNATGAETVEEKIKIEYTDKSMYWTADATVVLKDSREKAFISGSDVTLTYRDYVDADLMANFGLVDEAGNPVEGEIYSIQVADPYTFEGKNVSETAYELTVKFAGNENYRPAEKTFNITVVKAGLSIDLPNLNITHGDTYDPYANVTLGNAYGDKQEVIDSLVQIFIGLDVAGLKLTEENKIDGLATHVQITLPKDDTLATIFKTLGLDVYGEEGEVLDFNQLQDLLGSLDGLLGQFDSGNETVSGITNILTSVTDLVDLSALKITIGGGYPSDTGIYLYGAVSTSSNYETAFDVAYMVIAPETSKYTLQWNEPALTNALVTLPAFQKMDIGAKAIENKDFQAGYLILGINDETGDIYTTDIYGNINLNIWSDPDQINDNGGYVQLAYGLNYGDNQLVYAKPIVRSFAIVPGITEMEIVVDNQATADLYKTVFDNAPVDVTVRGVIPEGGQVKFHYYGIEANTKTYDSDIAPTHTGAYAITASLVTRDAETGDMTSVGLDVATVVIQPTESSVTMKELQTVVFDGENHNVADTMEITASSTVENLKPDTTVITASIATDGSFSENGWAAAQGTVNVDFPRWMDELIAKYAPSVKDGITLSELEAKLLNKLPTITDKLEELGATNEMVNSTRNLLTNVSSLLDEMPADAVLSFKDDYEVLAVGTYAVAAVVTDSDHIPSVDAGLLVIVPDADQVFLDWDYHDENNIWSRELLSNVSINATAFNDKAFTEPNAQATAKITYQFIGLDQDAGLKIYTDPAQLPNGVYTQIAYIELEIDSQIILSDIIARTIMIVPNMPELQIVDVNGAAQNKFEFTFDNEPVELYVNQNGTRIENEIRYIGLQTNGVEYDRTVAPVHAGVYTAITVVKTQENVGMDVALVTIAPAKSTISVTGGTVPYNGKEQTATVKAESPNSTVTSPDYILISGTVDISAGVQNIGLESLHGDVNIDLPKWLDDVLAKTDFNRVDADVASLANAISAYRDDLMNLIPEQVLEQIAMSNETLADIIKKVNSGIDELLKILEKLPDDVHLTFESNKGYTELGSYFYYGIVTDSDHIPAADTGLLVIEPAAISDDDVEVTFKPVYNGKEQTVTVVVKVGEKLLEEGKDYEVTDNAAINAGKYTLTVTGKGNYTGKVTAEWAIEKADATVTINNASKVYGEEDPEFTATITGLKGDDKLNVVFSREAGQDVGEYVISATIAADDAVAKNYNITIKTGILTITQKDITTGDGYPIYFQPGDANGMIKVGTTVYVDDVAYILDENCVAWAADKNRELAIGYVYKNSGNHTTDHAYSDTTKNMYIWDLQWNEETKSYKADRVEELDNLLSFAGGSIWLGSDGVNGIRTYYSTTADTEAVKGAFRNLGYEVVTHGVVVGWADKLNGSEPVPNGNNSAAGHSAGNGTFYDEIYPAADKYITPDLRARFYVELKNIETSESKIIYSGSVERSIGYIAYQNIGRVDAQYQPYVKAILDKAAAAGFTYGG